MQTDVVVIGAGAAGLAAAKSLAQRSLHVVLIEARDRIGGRVWSVPATRANVPAELGAEFIHGKAEETTRLLKEAGAAAIATGGESWQRTPAGALWRDDDDFASAADIFESSRSFERDESVDDFLRRFESDAAMRATVERARTFVEGFEAAEPSIASVQAIANEFASGVDSTSARPLGGYGPLFDVLADDCVARGVDLRLSTVVRRIGWGAGRVTVETADGGGAPRTIEAKKAVVTLPVGVLRHRGDESAVLFEPELPAAKLAALERIEMGHVVKVVLLFRTAFWEEVDDGRFREAGFFRTLGAFAAYWAQYPVRDESIVAWAGGPRATALRHMTSPQLVSIALDEFAGVFGEPAIARDAFERGLVHDWNADPFARGAYSYVLVGGGGARATLAAPVGDTLFFAGEATSTDGQGGTVNGAFETGERAALQAARALGAVA